ncbi:hypothetical protein OAA09_00660 [bacterium]|nr:hypothetical protein [bacterium]
MAKSATQLAGLLYEADEESIEALSESDWARLNSGLLTEEEINEILGFTRKKTLIKKIKEKDPSANEEELKGMSKSDLKKMLKQKREDSGEDTRGFFAKTVDRIKGIKDIGMFKGGAGTLLGGTETFDIKKRKELKDSAKAQAEKWLKAIEYKPLSDLYSELVAAKFPNKANKSGFKSEAQQFQKIYDDVVSAHEADQLDTKTANAIIAVLRGVVIYFQDFAMSDQYFYRENKDPSLADLLFEEVEGEEEKLGSEEGAVSKNFAAAYSAKFPLGLAAAGVAAYGAGIAANSEFFIQFLEGFKEMDKIPGGSVVKKQVTGVFSGDIRKGNGIIKTIRLLVPGASKFGTPGGPGFEVLTSSQEGGFTLDLIKNNMMDQTSGPAALDKLIKSGADPVSAFTSGATSGTGKAGEELFGVHMGKIQGDLTTSITTNLPDKSTPKDTVLNKFLSGLQNYLGPVLQALGLGMLAGAAASGFMRWKGKGGKKGSGKVRGSRMSILKVMVDGFKDLGKEEEGEDTDPEPPPVDPPEGEVEIVIDLEASGFVIKMIDAETGEEVDPGDLELDVEGVVPNLPLLAELGITTPKSIALLIAEAHTGTFTFKKGQKYPDEEGKFGSTSKNMNDYPTLEKLLTNLIKRAHPEMGDIAQKDIESALSGNTFTLNDKRGDDEDEVVIGTPPIDGPTKPDDPDNKPKKDDKPRLGLVRLDDDGLKLYRTRGGLGDKKYSSAKDQFKNAQDQALTGRGTNPSVEDIESDHKRQRRTPPASNMSYAQMVGRQGVKGKDLKKGVEVEPYFTIDKSAHSDLYLKRRKSKTIDGVGKVSLPGLGKDAKERSEQLLKKVFDRFVSGKKKLTRREANQIVMDYIGRGKKSKGFKYDKETRDKVVNVMIGYGLVKESVDKNKKVLIESKHTIIDLEYSRWETLAGIKEDNK